MTVLTIGYEGATLDAVLSALTAAGAEMLLDVRAVAASRRPGFSKRMLWASVEARGMRYAHLRALGTPKAGREAVRRGDVAGMRAIFGAHMEGGEAQAALAEAAGLAQTGRVCLLCFERDHAHCHRTIVADAIVGRIGGDVRHVTAV